MRPRLDRALLASSMSAYDARERTRWRKLALPLTLSHPDLGHYGHAQSQHMLGILALFEYDLDRNPLYHFDVVSCGILGRQEAEERAGGAGDRENAARVGAAVSVNGNSGGLPGPHALE